MRAFSSGIIAIKMKKHFFPFPLKGIVVDGTPVASKRLMRSLTWDQVLGVIHLADGDYKKALQVTRQQGIHLPMLKED